MTWRLPFFGEWIRVRRQGTSTRAGRTAPDTGTGSRDWRPDRGSAERPGGAPGAEQTSAQNPLTILGGHGHAMVLPCGPQIVIKDRAKGETQLIANPSYPRSALSLHFAMYAGRPPAKDSISRGLPGMFAPKYQESARGKRVASASASTCARHASSAGTVASIRVQLRWRRWSSSRAIQ